MKAIRISRTGGPEVMDWVDVDLPPPGPGEVRVKHTAIGVNFIDTYHRSGLYKLPLPTGLGSEAAGVVEAVGAGVTTLAAGDRVAYAGTMGAYAEGNNVRADRLVKIPAGVSDETAAAALLKGMTAQYLLKRTYAVKAGETIVFHSAAGGVGLIAGQWAKSLGAVVIGTVGHADKVQLARQNGYDHVLNTRDGDWVKEVRALTGGQGVPVVYELDRQGHVRRLAGLPGAARADGQLRQFVGSSAGLRARHPQRQGLALFHAPHPGHLHPHARRVAGHGRRRVRRHGVRRGEDHGQPALPARRRPQGARSLAQPRDDGGDPANSLGSGSSLPFWGGTDVA